MRKETQNPAKQANSNLQTRTKVSVAERTLVTVRDFLTTDFFSVRESGTLCFAKKKGYFLSKELV